MAVHPATGRFKELHRQLADEPEADDGDVFSEANIGLPDALQCNRAKRGERGVLEGRASRYFRDEILRDANNFGVTGVILTGTGNAVTNCDVGNAAADFDDGAGG